MEERIAKAKRPRRRGQGRRRGRPSPPRPIGAAARALAAIRAGAAEGIAVGAVVMGGDGPAAAEAAAVVEPVAGAAAEPAVAPACAAAAGMAASVGGLEAAAHRDAAGLARHAARPGKAVAVRAIGAHRSAMIARLGRRGERAGGGEGGDRSETEEPVHLHLLQDRRTGAVRGSGDTDRTYRAFGRPVRECDEM